MLDFGSILTDRPRGGFFVIGPEAILHGLFSARTVAENSRENNMSEQTQYFTANGFRDLETRLDFLPNVCPAEDPSRLYLALEEGGEIGQNAEYEDAKNEQDF